MIIIWTINTNTYHCIGNESPSTKIWLTKNKDHIELQINLIIKNNEYLYVKLSDDQ